MSTKPVLSARQRAFVAALASGLSHADAAATVGVTKRTASRYMAEPAIRAALGQAQADALGDVTRRMNAGSSEALDVLRDVMHDAKVPPGVRVRAAHGWLEASYKARELLGIEQRLEALEVAIGERGN